MFQGSGDLQRAERGRRRRAVLRRFSRWHNVASPPGRAKERRKSGLYSARICEARAAMSRLPWRMGTGSVDPSRSG